MICFGCAAEDLGNFHWSRIQRVGCFYHTRNAMPFLPWAVDDVARSVGCRIEVGHSVIKLERAYPLGSDHSDEPTAPSDRKFDSPITLTRQFESECFATERFPMVLDGFGALARVLGGPGPDQSSLVVHDAYLM
eukprot:6077587-Amphidinium_carterae.1